jgi:hypothetical protein
MMALCAEQVAWNKQNDVFDFLFRNHRGEKQKDATKFGIWMAVSFSI